MNEKMYLLIFIATATKILLTRLSWNASYLRNIKCRILADRYNEITLQWCTIIILSKQSN